MKDLTQHYTEYLQQKKKVEDINQSISKNETEIQKLEQTLAEARQKHQEAQKLQSTPSKLANGAMSSEEFLALKQGFYDQENRLKALDDTLQALKNARDLLFTQRVMEIRIFNNHRSNLAAKIAEQRIAEMADSFSDSLEQLIYSIVATKEPGSFNIQDEERIYSFIGAELCKNIFGEINQDRARLPEIHQAREKVDEMLAELS